MFNAASVLPAGPGERDDEIFPQRDRLRLRDNFAFVVQRLRGRPAFGLLAKGPWLAFIAIATHFQTNAEAWPSQDTIARFSGCSTRAVRYHVTVLEQRGVFVLRRERRGDGSERIFYQPGPLMLRELAAVIEDYPKDRAKPLPREPRVVPLHPPAESIAGPPAETVAMEPRDQDQIKPSSCESAPKPTPAPSTVAPEEENLSATNEDRAIARWALGERMKRKYPKKAPPRWFDRGDVEMVAACTAVLEGDRSAKEQVHREAIAGAFCTSKEGPPTSRFIWGKLEHFFEHVERGQKRNRNENLEAQRRQGERDEDERAQQLWRTGISAAAEHARHNRPSRSELAKMRAELEDVPPGAAPEFRAVLESMVADCGESETKAPTVCQQIPREQIWPRISKGSSDRDGRPMFRDDAQLARACRALLGTARLGHLWTDAGPTVEATELLAANGGPLSSGERVVLLATWAFWNGSGGLTLAEILAQMHGEAAEALCFLVMASKYGADAVDDWLAEHGPRGGAQS